jgi:phenylpropionate dioxygenase-like ring-hydroxylating dioxygenase large terminal subunit
MIPNQWYAVLESREVKPGKPVGVTRMGEKMVFWRDRAGRVVAMSDLCPHRGVALSAGKLKGDCIQCPFHGFEFDPSGRCVLIPANGRAAPVPKAMQVRSYPTYEAHDFIFIYWGEAHGDIGAPQWFDDIDDSFSYATMVDPWNTHYSRAIENQLDMPHVPFVHASTIGRGQGTQIEGPWVEWRGNNRFRVIANYRNDSGAPLPQNGDGPTPARDFFLELLFPNIWQNHLSDRMRIMVAFAPVDEEHTLLYTRQYQKFVRTPGLRTVVNKLSVPFNLLVVHQDRRIVTTQRPTITSLRIGEKLIPADRPIIEYRRRRDELKAAAAPTPSGQPA